MTKYIGEAKNGNTYNFRCSEQRFVVRYAKTKINKPILPNNLLLCLQKGNKKNKHTEFYFYEKIYKYFVLEKIIISCIHCNTTKPPELKATNGHLLQEKQINSMN